MSSYKTYFGTISVKDPTFGAVGNGVTDDTAAIQAAFDFAFTGGQGNAFANYEVYFPPGNYVTTSPLNLIDVLGGHIFGAGQGASQILFHATGTEGNSVSSEYPQLTPVFMLDGVSYTIFEDLSLTASATNQVTLTTNNTTAAGNNVLHFASTTGVLVGMSVYSFTEPSSVASTVTAVTSTTVTLTDNVAAPGVGNGDTIYFVNTTTSIYVYQSGSNGYTGANTFRDMALANFGLGILGGSAPGNCDNCIVHNVQFNFCALAGVRLISANALNWGVYGGGTSNCASASTFRPDLGTPQSGNLGAAYSVVGGSISTIQNMSSTGPNPETLGYRGWDVINAGAQGMCILGGRSETFQGIAAVGSAIHIAGLVYGGGSATFGCCFVDLTFSGLVTLDSIEFAPNNLSSGSRLIARLHNSGQFISNGMDMGATASQCVFTGANSAKITMNGTNGAVSASLFTSFTGTVLGYDTLTNVAVGDLPTAAAKFQGLRASVTDANATTFLSTVAGSGSNKVPVFCNGSNWVIG